MIRGRTMKLAERNSFITRWDSYFRVLYISLHCADAFPPNEGHPSDKGVGPGIGFNVNIGWLQFVRNEKKFLLNNAFDPLNVRTHRQWMLITSMLFITLYYRWHTRFCISWILLRNQIFSFLVQSRICFGVCWFRCRWRWPNRTSTDEYFSSLDKKDKRNRL